KLQMDVATRLHDLVAGLQEHCASLGLQLSPPRSRVGRRLVDQRMQSLVQVQPFLQRLGGVLAPHSPDTLPESEQLRLVARPLLKGGRRKRNTPGGQGYGRGSWWMNHSHAEAPPARKRRSPSAGADTRGSSAAEEAEHKPVASTVPVKPG